MRNARLDEAQTRIKTTRRNIDNLRYLDDTTLMAESEEELKTPLMRLKSWVQTLHSKNEDHGIRSHRFMANRRGKVETVTNFLFLGSKITADGDCSHEIKRCMLLGKKAVTNLDSILKSRDIALPTKVCIVKAMVFPVVVYKCESWAIKKPEHWRTDAFELWCWIRLLRVPCTVRRSNLSILKEINPKHSLEGLMLKLHTLTTLCEEPTHWKIPWCWERLRAGGEGGWQRTKWLDGIANSTDMNLSKLWERVKDRGDWHAAVHGS